MELSGTFEIIWLNAFIAHKTDKEDEAQKDKIEI